MSRALLLSALLVALGSSANAAVTSEGLYKGEQIVNMAKELLGDALNFVGDAASSAVARSKSAISALGDNDALMDFLGARGFTFDASDLIDGSLLERLQRADSFDAVYSALEDAVEDHCHSSEFTPSEKVNSKCVGPEIELELKPKTCYIDATGHSITCDPAKLVMKKNPAHCVYKHHSAFEFTGDWCAIEKDHGVETTITKGGDTYTTTVSGLKDGGHNLWQH